MTTSRIQPPFCLHCQMITCEIWVSFTIVGCVWPGLTHPGCVLPAPEWITTNSAKCMDLRSDFEPIIMHWLHVAHAQCAPIRMDTIAVQLQKGHRNLGLPPNLPCTKFSVMPSKVVLRIKGPSLTSDSGGGPSWFIGAVMMVTSGKAIGFEGHHDQHPCWPSDPLSEEVSCGLVAHFSATHSGNLFLSVLYSPVNQHCRQSETR